MDRAAGQAFLSFPACSCFRAGPGRCATQAIVPCTRGATVELTMTPSELKQARLTLGLTLDQMAMVLGYVGAKRRHMQYDLETGRREIREPQRRLVAAYLSGYRSDDWPEETT